MKLLNWLLYSNAWVASCFGFLLYGFLTRNHVEQALLYTFWGFSGTISAYQLHRLLRIRKLASTENPRLSWMQRNQHFQWLWFLLHWTIFAILGLRFSWNKESIGILAVLLVITGLYALPLRNSHGIRSIPFLKNIWIAGSWSGFLFIPFAQFDMQIPVVELALIFGAVYIQIIPFDLRDIEHDHLALRTIPQLLGRKNSVYFYCALILVISLFFMLSGYSIVLVLTYFFVGVLSVVKQPKISQLEWYEVLWELPLLILGLIFWVGIVI